METTSIDNRFVVSVTPTHVEVSRIDNNALVCSWNNATVLFSKGQVH